MEDWSKLFFVENRNDYFLTTSICFGPRIGKPFAFFCDWELFNRSGWGNLFLKNPWPLPTKTSKGLSLISFSVCVPRVNNLYACPKGPGWPFEEMDNFEINFKQDWCKVWGSYVKIYNVEIYYRLRIRLQVHIQYWQR